MILTWNWYCIIAFCRFCSLGCGLWLKASPMLPKLPSRTDHPQALPLLHVAKALRGKGKHLHVR